MSDTPPTQTARILIAEGLLDEAGYRYAQRVHAKLPAPKPLLQVIQELRGLSDEAVRAALQRHREEIRLGELLVELGQLEPADLETALELQREDPAAKKKLGEILVDHHFVDERKLVEVLSVLLGYPVETPNLRRVPPEILGRLPVKWCVEQGFVPIRAEGDRVVVAFADPSHAASVQAAEEVFGAGRVIPALARRSQIQEALAQLGRGKVSEDGIRVDESSVVQLVQEILDEAIERAASDIHIEPQRDRIQVRFREDGVLQLFRELPAAIGPALSTRIKVLSKADIAERRRHQDGRFFTQSGDRELDFRVSIYVTIHGEKIVMRLLNHDRRLVSLDGIGMSPRILERFRESALQIPSGVILITGPTGSGKTSTLYSCVNEIKNEETSIITAEDPVEYVIDGINQCSLNPEIGLTFVETLKHIVRQDPDVIVIGEIRDTFSAETAIQAALTGHKVITTFHTEDTIGGLLRLLNMDIEAFLVSSTVVSVLAQRLLRRVCPECAREVEPTPAEVRMLGYAEDALRHGRFLLGRGCDACRHTGYKGRTGVFELLLLDAAVRDAILARKTSHEIRRISRESTHLVTLLEDGVVKAARGETTIHEVIRMLPRLDKPRPLMELRRMVGE